MLRADGKKVCFIETRNGKYLFEENQKSVGEKQTNWRKIALQSQTNLFEAEDKKGEHVTNSNLVYVPNA